MSRCAIIVGAGPAGLTAAHELSVRTDIRPVVLEKSGFMGGISRTVNYKGNRIDIGGHRFFSKSDRVMRWWQDVLPVEGTRDAPDPATSDLVFLVRNRLSRIYYLRKFFSYPLSLSAETILKLGLRRTARAGASYLWSMLFPLRPEKSLEDFFINRFGRELYETFFRDYTEKVWGVPCREIGAEWGAQRIKGLSIGRAIAHMLKKGRGGGDVAQKGTETSLIERFLYPKFGPGQMWEEVARRVTARGGEILTHWNVDGVEHDGAGRVLAVRAAQTETGESHRFAGDFFFSTMPVQELVAAIEPPAPAPVREIGEGLMYRDFLTVGVLCRDLKLKNRTPRGPEPVRDNWIYIQEPEVQVGRLQIFNNWSPYMVADPATTWVGLEYFCNEGDALWSRGDADLIELAKRELAAIDIADPADVLDATVIRMPKAYPAYFGAYRRFPELIEWSRQFRNLYLVGRNGMHRYNNQDHSMLTAMLAVDQIASGSRDPDALWSLNTEKEYHEEK
ncbi:MAG: NAD(P)/FAD-dependent oxidoreductase [Acidobacteria bacterium]|nr:NAD(P)/FAD-dependent oxidoreductase [Acidobacteriota bacterium]